MLQFLFHSTWKLPKQFLFFFLFGFPWNFSFFSIFSCSQNLRLERELLEVSESSWREDGENCFSKKFGNPRENEGAQSTRIDQPQFVQSWFVLLTLSYFLHFTITIDAHGLKIQGEVPWGFSQILGGRVHRGCENVLGEGTPFWCFIAFLLTSFAKVLEGGYTFIPLTPPPAPPPCVHLRQYQCFPKSCQQNRAPWRVL